MEPIKHIYNQIKLPPRIKDLSLNYSSTSINLSAHLAEAGIPSKHLIVAQSNLSSSNLKSDASHHSAKQSDLQDSQSKRVQKLRTACYSGQLDQPRKLDPSNDIQKLKERKLMPYKVSAQQSLAAHHHSYQSLNKEQLPPNQTKQAAKDKAMQMYQKSMKTLEKLKNTYTQKNSSL